MILVSFFPVSLFAQYTAGPDTFYETFRQLEPGDTLLLEDGLYEQGISIENRHGSAGAPITIKAINERKALFRADGLHPALNIVNSRHWIIEGLRLENRDNETMEEGSMGGLIRVHNSHFITLRRNLCAGTNRWGNNTGILLAGGTTHSLVEENELYDFHRNGISFHGTDTRFNVLRRNYVSRGVDYKGRNWGPNDGIVMYRGADNIIENNIVEFTDNEGHGFGIWGERNRVIGNIAFKTRAGFPVVQGWRPHSGRADGTSLIHNLALDSHSSGFYTNSVADITLENNSSVRSSGNGITLHNQRGELREEGFQPSVRVVNHLSVENGEYGYEVQDRDQFTATDIQSSYGWNNGNGTWGNGIFEEEKNEETDPEFRGSFLSLPKGSQLERAGLDGEQVGADLTYRYHNGRRTNRHLWDKNSGSFPHGAVIEGVNDTEISLHTVHKRLFSK